MRLLDVEAIHQEHPRTYSIPRRAVRETLVAGDLVKLVFGPDDLDVASPVERMWVEITDAAPGRYEGTLENAPTHLANVHQGDIIVFGPEHVAARNAEPNDPLYTDFDKFAIVSRDVWERDRWPGRLQRGQVGDEELSGWLVLAGDESEPVGSDWENFLPIRQAELCGRFRVLDSGLEGPVGTVMVWNEEAGEYQAAAG
jgi:hypothetical protein